MEKQADAIISLLYEAAMDSDAWLTALNHIAGCVHASGASYFIWNADQQSVDFWCAVGHDEAMQQRYLLHYATLDPTRNAIMESRPGEMFYSSRLFPKSYIDRSEYFQDYLLAGGIGEVFGGKTMVFDGATGFFSVQQVKQANGFTLKEQVLLDRVVPHLVRASKMHARLTRLYRQTLTLEVALRTINLPVFVVDGARHIHYLNGAAEALLTGSRDMHIKSNILYCYNPEAHRKLDGTLSRATDPVACEAGALLVRADETSDFLTVVPIPQRQTEGISAKRLALIVGVPRGPSAEDFGRVLAELFSLTPAEKKLACKILDGNGVTEAADALGIGRETVRSQLRSLFEKTKTSRQAQLVSLLQALAFISPRMKDRT